MCFRFYFLQYCMAPRLPPVPPSACPLPPICMPMCMPMPRLRDTSSRVTAIGSMAGVVATRGAVAANIKAPEMTAYRAIGRFCRYCLHLKVASRSERTSPHQWHALQLCLKESQQRAPKLASSLHSPSRTIRTELRWCRNQNASMGS